MRLAWPLYSRKGLGSHDSINFREFANPQKAPRYTYQKFIIFPTENQGFPRCLFKATQTIFSSINVKGANMQSLLNFLGKVIEPLASKKMGGNSQWRITKLKEKLWPFLWRVPSISPFRYRIGWSLLNFFPKNQFLIPCLILRDVRGAEHKWEELKRYQN
jgi:hypothetical protein